MSHEESIFILFEMTPDLVCIVSREGYFKKINPAVSATLGYSPEELMALPVTHFIHPADKDRTAANRARLLDNEPLLNFQNRYLTKKGETVWLEWTSVYLADKELVFAIAKNITAGKLAEIALAENLDSLHQLTTHVKHHTEKERRQIAGTLHEDLGQLATVIKSKMEHITHQQQHLSPQSSELLRQVLGSTTQLLNKLRQISYSLSTDGLALLGLHASLQWLCGECSRESGLDCQYKGRFRESLLSEEEKLDLYRICQEALQNVVQHAAASRVVVSLRQTKRGLLLTITDNGIGFNPLGEKLSGISVMKARALSIQAVLTVGSNAKGSTISVLLKNKAAAG